MIVQSMTRHQRVKYAWKMYRPASVTAHTTATLM